MSVIQTDNPLSLGEKANGEFVYNGIHFNKDTRPKQYIYVLHKENNNLVALDRQEDFDSKIHKKLSPEELERMTSGKPVIEAQVVPQTVALKKPVDAKKDEELIL